MNIQELKQKSSENLISEAEKLGIENASTLRRQEIYFAILKKLAEKGEEITGGGVLQLLQDGFGFLRAIESNYLPGADDIYVSPSQIRRFGLRTGDTVEGPIRAPKESERYFALLQVNKINLPEMLSLIPSDYDIIYLGRCWDSCRRSVSLNRQIVKCHAPQCFHSYGVSREGAKKIIKYTKALIKPPDLTISEYIRSGKITAYAPKKSIFYQNRQEITSHLTEDRVTQKDCV